MQITNKLTRMVSTCLATTTAGALAGDFSDTTTSIKEDAGGGAGDWCESLQDIGSLYKNEKNPWIQAIEVYGRVHQQWGYVDGQHNGRDFSGDGDELRRLRAGTDIEFLDGFTLHAQFNFSNGDFRDTSIRYTDYDDVHLSYDFGDLGSVENLTVGYGRYKVGFGGEEWGSSKKIKTIERSNLNNYYDGERATGTQVTFEVNKVDYLLGVYAVDGDVQAIGSFSGDLAYQIAAEFKALNGDFLVQGVFVDSDGNSRDDSFGYDWAVNVTYETEIGDFDLFTSATYGEDYNGDAAYGIVVMPSTELIKNKLEAVFRYQWLHSEAQNVDASKRIVQRIAKLDGVDLPSGDNNHTFYAGLNYFLCDHNAKAMFGVEYETNDGTVADTEATTVWGALRFHF